MIDIRSAAAKYYDLQSNPFSGKDIDFYISHIPSVQSNILEIGCGTGRVTLPLASHCRSITGIDISASMIDVCNSKLGSSSIDPTRIKTHVCDVRFFKSHDKYDLIIAPFRVLQNIEEDDAIKDFFTTIKSHLSEAGIGIINVFKPFAEQASGVRNKWATMTEYHKYGEIEIGDSKLICFDKVSKVHPTRLICYPTLKYELYRNDKLVDCTELNIAMRCYMPIEFINLIEQNGFTIVDKWGGYSDEIYGEGPELVIKFKNE